MTGFNKHVYEMLCRLVVFGGTYRELFLPGTVSAELIEKIQAAVAKWSEHATSQASGKGAVRRWVDERAQARKDLRDQLESIYRIARANGLKQFLMPRDRGDIASVDIGKSFAANAEPLKQMFIGNHLPEDFIGKLNTAVQRLEAAIHDQTYSKAGRIAATGAIDQARTAAFAALERLDPIMENLLRKDPPTLGVWQSMRRVERRAAAKAPRDTQASAASTPA